MQRLAFILMPSFSAMAFFSALEPLRIANRLARRQLYAWTIHAPAGDHAVASNGMQLRSDGALPPAPDGLIVCAAFDPLDHASPALLGQVRRYWRMGCRVGAVDTGAFILAEAGILGRDAITLHWEAAEEFGRRYPQIPVSVELYERHGRLFTCAGGTAAMDMMLDEIGGEHGIALAKAVSDQLIHDRIRSPSESQRGEDPALVGHPVLGRVVRVMEANLAEALPLDRIAEITGLERRRIERQFQRVLKQSPAHYYRDLRLRHALALIREQGLPVHQAAAIGGFSSQPVFSRACRNHFGKGPRELLASGLPLA